MRQFVRRGVEARRTLDRLYWLRATADVVTDQLPEDHRHLLRLAARPISATRILPKRDHSAAIRFLFAKAMPVS